MYVIDNYLIILILIGFKQLILDVSSLQTIACKEARRYSIILFCRFRQAKDTV